MTYRGVVKNGVVVFQGRKPKEGTAVTINAATGKRRQQRKTAKPKNETIADALAPFIGMANDLPSDMSVQHDHYLYGTPKKAQ